MNPPAVTAAHFEAHWAQLKTAFDRDAPAVVGHYFARTLDVDLTRVQRLIVEGKSVRGCLVLLVCEALGGRPRDALPRAVLLECVQAATLVHDDIVDSDALRRGAPALWTEIGERRAVLLGDLMFATALVHAARLSHADVCTLAEAIATVASGAYREPMDARDLAAVPAAAHASLYERLIHCKTGALFGAAGELGALAAGASGSRREAAIAFATHLGEAYQMADDVTDLLCPSFAPRTAQSAAALAVLSTHFAPEAGNERAAGACAAAIDPSRLAMRVKREIDRRVALARAQVDAFATGTAAELLHAAAEFIVAVHAPAPRAT
ncbi:MAG: polyprenyl synthetase family protein [Pseudomonadota bacterium]|nr:polyprenyl synthetase family protein [Pseudomonadota bacterium]